MQRQGDNTLVTLQHENVAGRIGNSKGIFARRPGSAPLEPPQHPPPAAPPERPGARRRAVPRDFRWGWTGAAAWGRGARLGGLQGAGRGTGGWKAGGDLQGNVFCTGPGGVWVCSPRGERLGRILLPERPANLAWGEDGSVFFLTARTSVY